MAPGPRTMGKGAFDGPSGDRLARLAGVTDRHRLRQVVWCINVLDPAVDDASGARLMPKRHGRAQARRLLPLLAGRAVIFAGIETVGWFATLHQAPLFRWRRGRLETGDELVYGVIPHPSGLNRHWNDFENRRLGAEFLSAAVRLDPQELISGASPLLDVDDRRLGPIAEAREELWDVERAAEYLNVTPARIRRWVVRRQIPHIRLQKFTVRFRRSDLDAHVARCRVDIDHRRA